MISLTTIQSRVLSLSVTWYYNEPDIPGLYWVDHPSSVTRFWTKSLNLVSSIDGANQFRNLFQYYSLHYSHIKKCKNQPYHDDYNELVVNNSVTITLRYS